MPLPPAAPAESNPGEHTSWYGWQTLTADASALVLLISAATVGDHDEGLAQALAIGSLATYVAGGPIVHGVHGNPGRAIGSLGLRAGAPVAGALLGAANEDCHGGDFCGMQGAFVGFAVGAGVAMVLDAAFLAHETVPDEPVVTPVVTTGKNGTWLGLSGRF